MCLHTPFKWHAVDHRTSTFISSGTNTPGNVYSYDTGHLPAPLKQLPDLHSSYISGYLLDAWVQAHPQITIQGEIVTIRNSPDTAKGDVFLFGVSGTQVYFSGPYKPSDGHHFDDINKVPLDKLFGQTVPVLKRDESTS